VLAAYGVSFTFNGAHLGPVPERIEPRTHQHKCRGFYYLHEHGPLQGRGEDDATADTDRNHAAGPVAQSRTASPFSDGQSWYAGPEDHCVPRRA
jgi:hypothetical protein